ncbi:MAG: hypothetical protein II943_01355 [Victivallales bacterium]|nr:hypothetical protein [Victivallales bacterium]
MRIADPAARNFYEKEAAEGQWSFRQMSRQIGSQLYERSMKHKGDREQSTVPLFSSTSVP